MGVLSLNLCILGHKVFDKKKSPTIFQQPTILGGHFPLPLYDATVAWKVVIIMQISNGSSLRYCSDAERRDLCDKYGIVDASSLMMLDHQPRFSTRQPDVALDLVNGVTESIQLDRPTPPPASAGAYNGQGLYCIIMSE